MDVETIIKERLFSQFRNSPNIQALVEILSDPLQDTADVLDFILDHSSIDDAEGVQLDQLGARIGVERPPAQETKIFTLCRQGEIQDPDKGFSDDENPGGYMVTMEGLEAIAGGNMSDADFRYLIRQKAASYRKDATREILFLYMIAFGGRVKIDGDTTFTIVIDPIRYRDFNQWTQNYIETRGFDPSGVSVQFRDEMRHEDSV